MTMSTPLAGGRGGTGAGRVTPGTDLTVTAGLLATPPHPLDGADPGAVADGVASPLVVQLFPRHENPGG